MEADIKKTAHHKDAPRIAGLTDIQDDVARACGTEPPFQNQFWDKKRRGLYVDIVSGQPLFAPTDKVGSGTGWPSCPNGYSCHHVRKNWKL